MSWHRSFIPQLAARLTLIALRLVQIDPLQRVLALLVAAREVSYFIVCLLGVCYAPHYLLANPTAGWWIKKEDRVESHWQDIIMGFFAFVFSPEKWIIMTILEFNYLVEEIYLWTINFTLGLFDMCAMMALVVGAIKGTLPPALAVSYSITATAGVWIIGFFVMMTLYSGSGNRAYLTTLTLVAPFAIALNCAIAAALVVAWYWYFVWVVPVFLYALIVRCCAHERDWWL